jgi:hypothetical protein
VCRYSTLLLLALGIAWPRPFPADELRPLPSAQDAPLDPGERERVVVEAIANVKLHYFDRPMAQKVADALLAHQNAGDDDRAAGGEALAHLLTTQIRDVSHDMHLEVVYSRETLPRRRAEPTPQEFATYRRTMERDNCTFEKVEILPRNIGYLKLDSFPDPAICEATARAAMAKLNHADALIFDLRDNRGGDPPMVAMIAAYLFDHPEYWYNPREAPSEHSWTQSPVAGSKLDDKPVYVLTSHATLSGAEQFCFDLKMLKRATLVGETTGGGAHAGVFYRIDDHFGMGIPEARAVNPYAKVDWEEIGVEPDVKVNAADALAKARRLAEIKLERKR